MEKKLTRVQECAFAVIATSLVMIAISIVVLAIVAPIAALGPHPF